jgi:hypothetical protein
MDQQIKAQWVEALRSGTYTQCQSRLRSDSDSFCVNGVLCDLHARATGGQWERLGWYKNWLYHQRAISPSHEVLEWAGMQPYNAVTKTEWEETEVRNDGGMTFAELADYIEANL